jgi:hypothetical protein
MIYTINIFLFFSYTPKENEWETKPVYDPFRLDETPHLCVDQERTPDLRLIGESPQRVVQGHIYEEFGVTVRFLFHNVLSFRGESLQVKVCTSFRLTLNLDYRR